MKTLILGGGLAGLSCSYHLGHQNCLIIERNPFLGGHAATYERDGAFWDEGPHVSFTKNSDVKNLLAWSAGRKILDYPNEVGNYFEGSWIPHPAQSNLYAVPEPLASQCYNDFIINEKGTNRRQKPKNYQEWLDQAFGSTFSRTFPHSYTRKYWTCDPSLLTIDWVGERVFKPDLETVRAGYFGKPKANTHYISTIRYPAYGGFGAFTQGLARDSRVIHDEVVSIDLSSKSVRLGGGSCYSYKHLISTIPLDRLISILTDVPSEVREAATKLRCSSLLLINILGIQNKQVPYHWLYVYDEEKYSTRITQTHLLSPANTPNGLAGIQVEVYASPYRPFAESHEQIAAKVVKEVQAMDLLDDITTYHFHFVPYANIIYDHQRRSAQDKIFSYLSNFGLIREPDALEPMTDWPNAHRFDCLPSLLLAGRFGQWKYFWSDDCILRAQQIASCLAMS